MSRPFYIKQTKSGRVFDALNLVLMLAILVVVVYPFINVLAISFNDGYDAVRGGIYLWPRVFSLENYKFVLADSSLVRGFFVSVVRTMVGTATAVLGNALLGYIVSCRQFRGRKFMRILFLITMYFGGGLIPVYLLMTRLGLVNTLAVYWLPSIFSAYYMLLCASYIQNLPEALFEAARVDGASELRIFTQFIIPLSVPMLACISIYVGVGHWNSWFDVMIYNSGGNWDTLQVYLRKILMESEQASKLLSEQKQFEAMRNLTTSSVRAATTMVVTIPIVCIYPFFQKYFVGGITIGAVKG